MPSINLVAIHPCPSAQSIPLANAYLKTYAHESSVSIHLLDLYIGQAAEECAALVMKPQPDAIGFSMYVWNRDRCCEIAAAVRRDHPKVRLFCGGPEVTADPGAVTRTGIFDFIITGEGEVPFRSLCRKLGADEDLSGIPGLLQSGDAIIPPPAPLADLDSIPSPYLTGVIDTASSPGLLWQLSRGCSFTCDFCFDSRGVHGVRRFSLERLRSELRHFAETGVNQVFVLDSTFNLDQKRAKKILRMIRESAPGIHFHFEVRSEFIDREMAKLFAQISCSLQIGLQSADKEVLKRVGRSFDRDDFSARTGLLNGSGAVFGFDLIYGLPGDSLDGFKDSLDYALSLYPNHLDIFPLAVLPGTRLAQRGKKLGIVWDTGPPYLLEYSGSFSAGDMTAAAELATACDVFYTRGRSVAWFNAVVSALGMKPSGFLAQFSRYLIELKGRDIREADIGDIEIHEMMMSFLKQVFSRKKLQRFIPLVSDLVGFHRMYASALLAPPAEAAGQHILPADLCGLRLKPAPSTGVIRFTYDIEELLECGEPDIPWMYENLAQSASQAVIYLGNGQVCTESLAQPYISIIEMFRDNGNISGRNTGLSDGELRDFLMFALEEGILVQE